MDAGINFRVPLFRRRDAVQRINFWEQDFQRAAVAQRLEENLRIAGAERVFRLFPHALRREMRQFTGVGHLTHQRHGFIGNTEAQMGIARGKARHAQHAQRVFTESRGDVAQNALLKVGLTAVRVNNSTVGILSQGVDG